MDFRKLGMEAMGTFFLVLVASTGEPLSIGFVLAIMVYIGGNISGGHYNPAVSLAVYLRGKLPMSDLFPYIIAQCAGGLAGALIAFMIDHNAPVIQVAAHEGDPSAGRRWAFIHGAIAVEFLFTFLLAYTVLTVATTKKHAGNPYYGLCIGGVVFVAAMSNGNLSGGAFNPAVGLAKSIVGMFGKPAAIQWFWVYLVFPMLGGFCAALAFNFFHADEAEPMPKIPIPGETPAPAAPAPEAPKA